MRKQSMELAARTFDEQVDRILEFTKRVKEVRKLRKSVRNGMPQEDSSRFYLSKDDENVCFDIAIISLYREFENLILKCLVALINNDSSTFSERTGRQFPKHMNVKVCEYLICGDGYFNFKGRGGLIDKIREFVPLADHHRGRPDHWLLAIVKKDDYEDALNKLSGLRNFAAHNSSVSKKKALKSINETRRNLPSSGAYLKVRESGQKQGENRFTKICESLKKMAKEIEENAPY